MKLEVPESFKDVAVEFSSEEWKILSKQEKALHREVMVQNYENMISVGYDIPLKHLCLLIEKDETAPFDGAARRGTLQQNEHSDGRINNFSNIQTLQTSQGKYLNSENDNAFLAEMPVRRVDPVWTESRQYNSVKYNTGFNMKPELELCLETHGMEKQRCLKSCKRLTCHNGSLNDESSHRLKRQRNAHSVHKQIVCREHAIGHKGSPKKNLSLVPQITHVRHRSYKCTTCSKSLTQKCSVEKHQLFHTDCQSLKDKAQKMHRCAIYDKSVSCKKSMVEQETISTGQTLYKCTTCDKGFIDKTDLEAHKGMHTGCGETKQRQKPYKCSVCDKCFTTKTALAKHMTIHTGLKPYRCNTCDKGFVYKKTWAAHQTFHTGQKPFRCSTCDKSFMNKAYLATHQNIHTGHKPYKCTTCDKAFTVKSNLAKHNSIHTGQKPYKCSSCDKAFITKNSMEKHHQSIHTGLKPYKCTTCDKCFINKDGLAAHMSVHTGQKPYKCTTCNKGFTRKNGLAAHITIHTGQKPFKCAICDRGFVTKGNLAKHQSIHSGQKPYKCSVCDKSFTHKKTKVRHENIHTGQRPYKCTTCGKGFGRKCYLIKHQSVHSVQKPYKCATCGKGFAQQVSMKKHQSIHTGDNGELR